MTWLSMALAAQLVIPSTPPPAKEPATELVELPRASALPPPAIKLEYTGQPLVLSQPACTDEEIQALGLTCTREDPCPVYLELAAHEVLGNTIVLTGNIHSREATFSSVLLVSEDLGKTWTEPLGRIKHGVLDQVQFIDFQNGWVAGQVMQQFARDPFLLITNDGGRTWRRRPLYEDARIGSIEQFWFESKQNGGLIVDRTRAGDPRAKYELYESQTGGASWTLREVNSKPIQPKRAKVPVPNTDYRLRADAKLNAYRLERRQGAQWQSLAAFSINLAACMPPKPPEPTPPPVVEEAPPPAPVPSPAKPPSLKKKP
ncbi:MAG: hypothetical protein K2X03_05640 [Bryobacteraceae bacterium]|nr:hypothetical protein [Bryobacteraceae bacterium]